MSEAGPKEGKSVFIRTYGCQMNVYDSERMVEILKPLGYEAAAEPDNADLVILNTCHIREKAAEKVYSELGRLKKLKNDHAARGKEVTIAVAGCVEDRREPPLDLLRHRPSTRVSVGWPNLPMLNDTSPRGVGR